MIKKCIGCGLLLQDTDKEDMGYTPDIKNDYCMRCFRLKNYGEKRENETVDEEAIIKKVNKSKGVVFFLIDYLNLNKYTLDIFKKVKLPKVLIVSKSDTLRREMKFSKIKNWLNKVYDIHEEIAFISNKNNFKNINIFKYMDKISIYTCYIMGITNAGKSTFINSILKQNGINKEIVTSNKPNTTLDFIKLKINDYVVYDTPGFLYLSLNYNIANKEIRPVSLNITKPVTVSINGAIDFYFDSPNNITIYATHNNIKKIYKNTIKNANIVKVSNNSDIIIPGVGFINVKKTCKIESIIDILEVRPNISGEDYE